MEWVAVLQPRFECVASWMDLWQQDTGFLPYDLLGRGLMFLKDPQLLG